ncbi:MAG TPA: ion transporter [Flavobacteriales bacterium]|jgi:hypothetical protein|nr:ion transporter [Flavobacteriales bacterium]
MNNKVINFLDCPKTKLGKFFSVFLLILIYLTVVLVIVQERFSESYLIYKDEISFIENFILFIFAAELIARLVFVKDKFKYVFSFYGVVDILAVVPGMLAFILPIPLDSAWLRVFRIFRITRVLKMLSKKQGNGIIGKIMPYVAIAVGYKGVLIIFEGYDWWPKIENMNTAVSVIGFSLAVLLGTKMSVTNNRIFQIEDAVCRVVGSMRDMQSIEAIRPAMKKWSILLYKTLKHPQIDKGEAVDKMRSETDSFEVVLESNGVGGPNTAGFHRDVSFLLHRVLAKTPAVYDGFLRIVITLYILVLIFIVPGIGGLVLTVLMVYVLGGMYFLIEDMDNPLSYEEDSFIDVRLDALEFFNK